MTATATATRKWERTGSTRVVSGEYTIITASSFGHGGTYYIVRFQGKTLDTYSRLKTAKSAVEEHAVLTVQEPK